VREVVPFRDFVLVKVRALPQGLAGAFAAAMTMAAGEGEVVDKGPEVPTHIEIGDHVLFLPEHSIYPGFEGQRLVPAAAIVGWIDGEETLEVDEDDVIEEEDIEEDEGEWEAREGAN
jgi:co-chaperonin GroES (HSP10)